MKYLKLLSKPFIFLLLLQLFAIPCLALKFPTLNGRVYDEANMINEQDRIKINNISKNLEKETTSQLVVATFNSLQGESIENFGYQLGRHWGIGQKKQNNGVILIIAPKEKKVRIEVGYGLEGILTDAICASIIHKIILPNFKTNNFEQGIIQSAEAIAAVLYQDPDKVPSSLSELTQEDQNNIAAIMIISILAYIIHGICRFLLKEIYTKTNNHHLKFAISALLTTLFIFSIPMRFISLFGRGRGGGGGGSFGGGGASGRF